MEDFAAFCADNIIVVDEDALSEAMSEFIIDLDDDILDALTPDQTEAYEEIVIAAALDGEDLEEGEEVEILEMSVNTNKGKVSMKDNDTIEYEAKPGVVRVGMAGECVKKGVKFKKSGKWYVAESEVEVEVEEGMPAKRVRRDIQQKKAASREHRKVKAKKKIEGRRKRKTASFKRYKKKAKRLGKRGLTSTGTRKRTFINKG
jgi:hypothetical protein